MSKNTHQKLEIVAKRHAKNLVRVSARRVCLVARRGWVAFVGQLLANRIHFHTGLEIPLNTKKNDLNL